MNACPADLSEVNVAADQKTSKTSLTFNLPKNTFIMLTLTLFTLPLIARTTFVLGSEALDSILESHEDDTFKFEMSKDTFKSVKSAEWIDEEEDLQCQLIQCARDELCVQIAVAAWTSALKQKMKFDEDDEDAEVMKQEDIDATEQEIEVQMRQVGAWKIDLPFDEEDKDHAVEWILIIREIGPNIFEWMRISVEFEVHQCVKTGVEVRDFKMAYFNLLSHENVDASCRFIPLSDENGKGQPLVKISNVYAQQRAKKVESEIRDLLIEGFYSKNHLECTRFAELSMAENQELCRTENHYRQSVRSLCESIRKKEKIATEEPMKRDAIKRGETHRFEAIHDMAAMSKYLISMRCKSENDKLWITAKLRQQLVNTKAAVKNTNEINHKCTGLAREMTDIQEKKESQERERKLSQEVDRLKSQHASIVNALRSDNQRQRDQVEEERKRSEHTQAELDELRKKQEELEEKNTHLSTLIVTVNSKWESKVDKARNRYNDLKSETEGQRKECEKLGTQKSSMRKEINDLVSENQQFKKDIKSLRTTNEQSMQQQMDQSNQKIQGLQHELAESRKVTDTLRKEQREQHRQMDALNERLKHTEGERDSLKSDVSASTAMNNQQRQQISRERETAEEDRIQLEQFRSQVETLENLGVDRQRELDECQQAVIDAEEQLRRNAEEHDQLQQDAIDWKEKLRAKEAKIDYWIIMALLIGGGILAVIGFTIFVLARRSYKQMSDDMMYQLDVQSEIMKPYEAMPAIPSAHANRLGVHEHPAVRDVFGMKEPWDVTAGEGFHVSRITEGLNTARETTRQSTELNGRDKDLDAPQDPGLSEYEKEDEQRESVMVGLPPPPPNVDIDEGGEVVIEMPCDIPNQDRPFCVSVNDAKVPDNVEKDKQLGLDELCDNLDI